MLLSKHLFTRSSLAKIQTKIIMKSQKGFTLIELLVVLASLNTAREKARDARKVADMGSIRVALELYADSNNSEYPSATSSLVDDGYLPAWPVAPEGSGYQYVASGTTSYVLSVGLEGADAGALDSDVDGTRGPSGSTVDCDDPTYCLVG